MKNICKSAFLLFVMLFALACSGPAALPDNASLKLSGTAIPDSAAVLPAITEGNDRLYFLAVGSLWAFSPGDNTSQQVVVEEQIVEMDVWPGDNRIAYATSEGVVYLLMPGQAPKLIHDLRGTASVPLTVEGIAWSSDGTKLAYTVEADTNGEFVFMDYPSQPFGLWVFDMQTKSPTYLLSNHYWKEGETDATLLSSVIEPGWSPTDDALLLSYLYWEWNNYSIFTPLDTPLDENNLHDFEMGSWDDGFWTLDGQAVLLSSGAYDDAGDLKYVERATQEATYLIDGEPGEFNVRDAQEIADGIVFLSSDRLYLGQLTAQGFDYAPVGPELPCEAQHIEWQPSASRGALLCSSGEIYEVSLDGANTTIAPYDISLPGPVTDVQWGRTQ